MIDQCLKSAPAVIWTLNGRIWTQAFQLYIDQCHIARPKSSRQLLVAVTAGLRTAPLSSVVDAVKQDSAFALVRGLLDYDDPAKAKACASALSYFLAKDVLYLHDILRILNHVQNPKSEHSVEQTLDQFLEVLFRWLGSADFSSTIGHLVSVTLDRSSAIYWSPAGKETQPVWCKALIRVVEEATVDISTLRVHVLPMLFKRSFQDFVSFLIALGLEIEAADPAASSTEGTTDESRQERLLFATLQAGKELGLLDLAETLHVGPEASLITVPFAFVGRLMMRHSPDARSTGLTLLIASHAMTTPFSCKALNLLKHHLNHFLADPDANFRGKVFSLMQRLLDRMRAVSAVLARQVGMKCDARHDDEPARTLYEHKTFLKWLVRCLTGELRPSASYQRHISALKILLITARSGMDSQISTAHLSKVALGETRWPFSMNVFDGELRALLLELVIDPYDDVRHTAAQLLQLCPTGDTDFCKMTELALHGAEATMLASGRADHADGYALLYALSHQQRGLSKIDTMKPLLDRLSHMLDIAEGDLAQAVERYPIHGLLTSMRYVLVQGQTSVTNHLAFLPAIIANLERIWALVKPILCNDAPEGYVPEDLEDATAISTKDTLSYCWRALKEASLLLSIVVGFVGSSEDEAHSKTLCNLCFTQLAELRHRGAFSTVAQTWVVCCAQARSQAHQVDTSLLQIWYDRTMLIMLTKSTINTRRSAGLPSLLCGILIADPSGRLLGQAFADLDAIAREDIDSSHAQEGSLAQVHAMNCMKDILKNSRLGEQSEAHLPTALRLAADALRSEAWAFRNCGLMLFRAVIDRLLGTSEAFSGDEDCASTRLSTEQHPSLLEIVVSLLHRAATNSADVPGSRAEGAFLALQLLQHLRLDDKRDVVKPAVFALIDSPSWHIRDKAARAYASMIGKDELTTAFDSLLQLQSTSQNQLHGTLLCAKYLVYRINSSRASDHRSSREDVSPTAVQLAVRCLSIALAAADSHTSSWSPVTKAAYVDVVTELLALVQVHEAYKSSSPTALDSLRFFAELRADLESVHISTKHPGSGIVRLACVRASAHELAIDRPRTEVSGSIALIVGLAESDSDACRAFLRRITSHVLPTLPPDSRVIGIVVEACTPLYREDLSAGVRCEAINAMLKIAELLELANASSPEFASFAQAKLDVHVDRLAGSQDEADSEVQLLAACIQFCHNSGVLDTPAMRQSISSLVSTCEAAAQGYSVCSREAVAHAIKKARLCFRQMLAEDSLQPQMLRLCVTLYDLLNDDDEDIRLLASEATSSMLWFGKPLVPLVAGQKLAAFMLRQWPRSQDLIDTAFSRAFGSIDECNAASSMWPRNASHIDTALFAEEKQNLYIDDAREVKIWTQMLLMLPLEALSNAQLKTLAIAVDAGLATLTTNASTEVGGGQAAWPANADSFVAGLRVICGAQVLLNVSCRGRKLSLPPSILRKRLEEFATACDARDSNVLWVRETRRVLVGAVAGKMRLVSALLAQVSEGCKFAP